MTPKPSERGVALLTVLAIVAIMSVIAASAIERVRIATRLTVNIAAADQARAYGQAAEAIALSRIADLFPPDRATTTLAGDWNGRALPYPIDGGSATVTLTDAGNCFNLNSLVQGGAGQPNSFRPAGLAQFEALLFHLGVGLDRSRPVGLAIADWIDADTAPLPGGAEDGAYTGFRTANSLMVDASEVRVVRGMTPELYRLIRPWLCALPVSDLSPINVNTIQPAQAPLIAMLVPTGLDVRGAATLIQSRPANGFDSSDAFWLQLRGGVVPAAEARAQTKVKTIWFGLETNVTLAGAEHRGTALIDAAKPPAKIVRRAYGDPV
jgi:general secretion pathway protein K